MGQVMGTSLPFTISHRGDTLHKIPSRHFPAQESCRLQSQPRPGHSARVSPAPWSHMATRPGAKAGSGPGHLAALTLGLSDPGWNPGAAISFLDTLCRSGHIFLSQFPHLLNEDNVTCLIR